MLDAKEALRLSNEYGYVKGQVGVAMKILGREVRHFAAHGHTSCVVTMDEPAKDVVDLVEEMLADSGYVAGIDSSELGTVFYVSWGNVQFRGSRETDTKKE